MRRRHMAQHDRHGQQRVERQRQRETPAEYAVQPIVAVDCQNCGSRCRNDRDHAPIPAEHVVQAVRGQYGVGDVEADEREQRADQDDRHAPIAELRPRLDHLRQSELDALRGVEGDEYRAEEDAERTGQRGVSPAEAHRRPDEADRDREEMKVAEEPERHLVDHAPVPFITGDVIDGLRFNRHAPSRRRWRGTARTSRPRCRWRPGRCCSTQAPPATPASS